MSTLIFDFDGTIADTFFIARDVFRKLAKGRHPNDDEEIETLRSLTAREVIQRVGVKWWELPYVAYYVRMQVKKRQGEIKPIAGMGEAVQELHKRGHRLYIVSSNATKNVQRFLERNNLQDYFDSVYGGIGLFDKASGLRKITQHEHVALEDCYYIGDEARDVEAARRAHMKCVSVSWGYNNMKGLSREHPETVVHTPKELLAVFPKNT